MSISDLYWQRRVKRIQSRMLSPQIMQFADFLKSEKYSDSTTRNYIRISCQFSEWIEKKRISPHHISSELFLQFNREFVLPRTLRSSISIHAQDVRAVGTHLMRILGCRHVPPVHHDHIQNTLDEFAIFLSEIRGFRKTTIQDYCRRLGTFIRENMPNVRSLKHIPLAVLHDAVFAYLKRFGPCCTQRLTSALRNLLRFLLFKGVCVEKLLSAIPSIPLWRTSEPPKILGSKQRRKLLKAFDRSKAIGKRDYAMAVCMLELGLRAVDVSELEIHHIDWQKAILTVPNTKQRHLYILPLTQIVAEAIDDYICHGRPSVKCARIFLRHAPPRRELSAGGVQGAMKAAFRRADISECGGTHSLRRTIASQIHMNGGSVKDIADFLGHTSLKTASVYALTDEKMLRAFASPWPEVRK